MLTLALLSLFSLGTWFAITWLFHSQATLQIAVTKLPYHIFVHHSHTSSGTKTIVGCFMRFVDSNTFDGCFMRFVDSNTTFESKLVSPMHHHHHYVGLISVYPHRAVSQRWRITSESLICPLVVVTTTRTDLVNGTPAVPFITVCCTKVEDSLGVLFDHLEDDDAWVRYQEDGTTVK